MKKAVIIGSGKLAAVIAQALAEKKVAEVELLGIFSPTYEHAKALADKVGVKAYGDFDKLLEKKPDYVIEAATAQAVRDLAIPAIRTGAELLVLSTGAFEEDAFYKKVESEAGNYDSHVYLVPGAIGGFDIIGAAKLTGEIHTSFIKNKLPRDAPDADFMSKNLPDEFRGSARELFHAGPSFLNVAVSAGIAANGLDETEAAVVSGETVNFVTELTGEFGKASIYTELGKKGYEFIGYSAIYLLQRLNSRITF